LLATHRLKKDEIARNRARLAGATRFFGLDIHRDYMVATAVNAELEIVFGPARVGWEQFEGWITRTLTGTDALCVEMTTNTWQVVDTVQAHVHSVTVVHPPHLKLITAMPVMNDKRAAEALATLLAAGFMRSVWVPDQAVRDRRQLVAQRHDRVKAASIAKNRLRSLLHRHQFEKPEKRDPFTHPARDFWLSLPVSAVEKLAIELDLETIDQAQAQQERIEAVMREQAVQDERLPFLLQLPGISVIGAFSVLAAIGDIARFPSAKHLVGYAGLGARVHDSGQGRWSGSITKTGRKDLRYVLVNAAQVAARSHPFWQAELARMLPRTGRNKAIVAIARKLLVSVWHVLTRREADRRADPAGVARSLASTAYVHLGAAHLPDGETGPEFVRRNLDALGIGKDLQTV
jgi:transposase